MDSKLYIPKKIKVGYNKRSDTYDGKLAYIIYIDHKGVLRKAGSWNSWRNTDLGEDDYDNEPIEGFVINKPVGGVISSYGWDARIEKIRIYDPRGFEFEITTANLLFILQECSTIKGKGIEGKFVYSWDGKDIVLLPCSSSNYQSSVEDTKLQSLPNIKLRELVIGKTYEDKEGKILVYMGSSIHNLNSSFILKDRVKRYWDSNQAKEELILDVGEENRKLKSLPIDKGHYYYDVNNETFIPHSTSTKVSRIIDDNEYAGLADLYTEFYNSAQSIEFEKIEESRDFSFVRTALESWGVFDKSNGGYLGYYHNSLGGNSTFYHFAKKIDDNNYTLYRLGNNIEKYHLKDDGTNFESSRNDNWSVNRYNGDITVANLKTFYLEEFMTVTINSNKITAYKYLTEVKKIKISNEIDGDFLTAFDDNNFIVLLGHNGDGTKTLI